MNWRNKAYDGPLPALAIRGPELRRSLRLVTVAYMYGVVHLSCITGSQINIFSEMLGFNDFHFGLLAALPFLATFAQLFATIPIEQTGLRKHQLIECEIASRLLWIALAAVPLLLPIPSPIAVWTMLGLILLSNSLQALAVPAWWTWIGDMVPRRLRGRYMAARETYAFVARLAAVIAIGLLMDIVSQPETKAQYATASAKTQPILLITICGLFVVAGLLGVATILFRKIREIKPSIRELPVSLRTGFDPAPEQVGPLMADYRRGAIRPFFSGMLIEPLRDKAFRNYAMFCAMLTFGANISGVFLWRNVLNFLGFSKLGANFQFMVVGTLSGMLTIRLFGKLIDRFGRRPVIILSFVGIVLTILPWAFIMPETPDFGLKGTINWVFMYACSVMGRPQTELIAADAPLGAFMFGTLAACIGGAAWAGMGLAQANFMFRFNDQPGRSRFIACLAVVASMGGLLGGLIGGAVSQALEFLQRSPIILGPIHWNNWHIVFMLSSLCRLSAAYWLFKIPDTDYRSVGEVLRHLGTQAHARMLGRFLPARKRS